jgi:hypothetical protein
MTISKDLWECSDVVFEIIEYVDSWVLLGEMSDYGINFFVYVG